MKQRQSGFSLVEMLVVVAIIGIVSLVTVPNFMAMRRANMLKNSMRNFVGDIRGARQRAVTRNIRTRLQFTNGSATTGRDYTVWELPVGTTTWVQVGNPKRFEETCYVSTETNIPTPDSGATYQLEFRSDGTAVLNAGTFEGTAVVTTTSHFPNNEYTVHVLYSGAVRVTARSV